MEPPDATTAGIMRLEATWSVLAHVKRFLVRSLEELRTRVPAVGGTAWTTAVDAMGGWGRQILADHVHLNAWRAAYHIMATQYAMEVAAHRVSAGGKLSVPSAGLFMEAVVRNASATPAVRDGTILTSTTGDQDRVTADVLRTALGDVFHQLAAMGSTKAASPGSQKPPASQATSQTSRKSSSMSLRSAAPVTPPMMPATPAVSAAASSLTPDDSVSVAPAMARSLDDLHRSCFFSLPGGHANSQTGGALDPPVSMAETVGRG